MPSHTPAPSEGPIEYLDDQGRESSSHRRRNGLVAAATVAVVGAGAAGAWAVAQFMSGGPAAATAVPADALVYLSLDLDPDGGQKVEAAQTLQKFPVIRDELGIDAGSDLRRVLYDALTAEQPCPEIDFTDDVDPWLGGKVAVAAVPGDDEPVPFLVIQVREVEAARAGLEKIASCADEEVPGTAFVGEFMVVAESDEAAEEVAAGAEAGSLADDAEFDRWIGEAGGSGVLEGYLSAGAPAYFADEMSLPTGTDGPAPGPAEALEGFEGGALVVRFDDEALEVEMAAGGLPADVQAGGDSGIDDLPASTAAALGFEVSDTAVQDAVDGFVASSGMDPDAVERFFAEAEAQTGLELPEELQTLLGDGFSVALDSSVDIEALAVGEASPAEVPAGVRVVGNPDEITGVLDKLLVAAGPAAGEVVVTEGDGVVAIGLDSDYVATLAEDGSLGDEDRFQAALDDVDRRSGAVYVDFDAGDWLTELAATDPDERIEANLRPLDSLGIGGWWDGDVTHGLVKLTTD